ncbi:MAG TPA: hypothetical protein VHJ83_07025 [Micromonosporaceae bacterium]|jgi:hypothetical protein|nr:hypothetical protein [Micromonosporaceae bacterium]
MRLDRPNAERRQRRLRLLAELADLRPVRGCLEPRHLSRVGRIRELIAARRLSRVP